MTNTAFSNSGVLYYESLRATTVGSWLWCGVAVGITFFAIAPLVVPVTLLAWAINFLRFRNITIRIDRDYVWVGHRYAPLQALDLTTLGRASNTWPWRSFNPRYLGANPIWTQDSVGVRGRNDGKRIWLSVGTNRRDELAAILTGAAKAARARADQRAAGESGEVLPPPSWHADPWDPVGHLRWWDGVEWTGHTWPRGAVTHDSGSAASTGEVEP